MLLATTNWVNGKDFLPLSLNEDNIEYQCCNDFTLRYGFVIKVAEIGWYAPACDDTSLLKSNNKILRFHYFKDVKADFFKQSAEEYFLLNLDNRAQQTALLAPLKNFNDGYTNIQPGEFFQLVHTNQNKLSLYRNKDLLASTENADIATKYFNIWFGKIPVIEKLKKAFL